MTPAVGFTGTREGMTSVQVSRFLMAMHDRRGEWPDGFELHHGCCIGADEQAVLMARALIAGGGLFSIRIIAHPAIEDGLKSQLALALSAECREPLPFLDRNKAIVDESQYLIATPDTAAERQRSGTWATVRYSRKLGRDREVVGPNGETSG